MSFFGLGSVSTVEKILPNPTMNSVRIAGASFWAVRAVISAVAAGGTSANMPYWKAPVPIARAGKFISTRLPEAASTQRVYRK